MSTNTTPLALSQCGTRAATTIAAKHIRVALIVWMALIAVCSGSVSGSSRVLQWAASYIFLMCDGFKMARIDTGSISTQMVNLKSVWDRSLPMLIGGAVREYQLWPYREMAVTATEKATAPFPAMRLIQFGSVDFCHKARVLRVGHRSILP
jgi:hypothetical protein